MTETRLHRMRVPPAFGQAARKRKAERLTEKLAARGYRTVRYVDGGALGNSYIFVEGPEPGPIDWWGMFERLLTAAILAAAIYVFYTRVLRRGG